MGCWIGFHTFTATRQHPRWMSLLVAVTVYEGKLRERSFSPMFDSLFRHLSVVGSTQTHTALLIFFSSPNHYRIWGGDLRMLSCSCPGAWEKNKSICKRRIQKTLVGQRLCKKWPLLVRSHSCWCPKLWSLEWMSWFKLGDKRLLFSVW